ncbi:hypothetical protein OHA27_19345 [Streptomyces sp. NBC_01619]|uniref:hypothetical protein n=1 Tax=Streptomyces sp. NBC_01619 TaxID=2975901 RepID=UPI00225ACD0A|nr:hypothetical protein [Streptomyces sp. NBC_01619]MCX4512417.1 hypothetical protein [Streptomyces sp. NBC_01619]
MPTPYGSRGGMAFSADELRVLRRALAIALHPDQFRPTDTADGPGGNTAQECLRLAQSVDEAVREAGRLRTFLLADLARYRDALPGSEGGYLELLQDALAAGYEPAPEDLAALRSLRRTRLTAALLERCQDLAEESVRARLAGRTADRAADRAPVAAPPRIRLLALPGGRAAATGDKPEPRPADPKPSPRPAPRPDRPIPTPGEVFPPRRRPVPPPEKRAAG